MRWLLGFLLLAVLALAPRAARAEQVAVLPLTTHGTGAAPPKLEEIRGVLRAAVLETKNTLPTGAQLLTAEMAMRTHDGTSAEFRAAGRASGSDWTATGKVEDHGPTYRLELVVCNVASGRVETLAREVESAKQQPQVTEMAALLLRPEGIANADIPWEQPPPPSAKPPPKTEVITTPPPRPEPPAPPAVRHAYAEGHPIAVGLSLGVLSAVKRAENATGSAASMLVGGAFGYALPSVPGLELRGDLFFSVSGPQSISADAGARYAIPIAPAARFFLGPEAELGVFGALGGEKVGRFLLRGGAFAALGLGERVQLELAGDLGYAAGGSASLVLAGASARGLVRF